jgi:mannose-6-phosphate isomerase-like protein (cupin superfamily)
MPIIDNSLREEFSLPGLKHKTLASAAEQLQRLEVWMQTLEPGAATPVHYHECEEVVVVLSGTGRLSVAGETTEFGPGTTLVVAPKAVHQLINSGTEEMSLIAGLSETPARVFAPDGSLIALPWS